MFFLSFLPPPVREGPTVPAPTEQQPQPDIATSEPSDNGVEIVQLRDVWAEQYCEVGTNPYYNNEFHVAFCLTNTTTSSVGVKSIQCDYDDGGESKKFDSVHLGTWEPLTDVFDFRSAPTPVLPPKGFISLAVSALKVVNEKQIERQNRAHRSLPQPLKMQFIFTLTNGRTTTITVTQLNSPMWVTTPERVRLSAPDGPNNIVYWFCFADDTRYETRIYSCCLLNKNDELILASNRTHIGILPWDRIMMYAFDGIRTKQSEVLLQHGTDTTQEALGVWVKTWILVDVENGHVKGFKVEAKTTTSHTLEYFPPPPPHLNNTVLTPPPLE